MPADHQDRRALFPISELLVPHLVLRIRVKLVETTINRDKLFKIFTWGNGVG